MTIARMPSDWTVGFRAEQPGGRDGLAARVPHCQNHGMDDEGRLR